MLGTATRAAVVTGCAAIALGTVALPSDAATQIQVALNPNHAPVGQVIDVHAASGLAAVTAVTFGAGSSAARAAGESSDTDVHVTVPAGAKTGVLTLTGGSTTLTTDKTFTVQQATQAAISRSRAEILFPGTSVITARLTAAGVAVEGQPAKLQRMLAGQSRWHGIQDAKTTSSTGTVRWQIAPRGSGHYRVVFASVPAYLGSTTKRVGVAVRSRVLLKAPGIRPILTRTELHGRVRPTVSGAGVSLLQKVDGSWQRIARGTTNGKGRFAFHVSFPRVGRYAYRVREQKDPLHRAGLSSTATVSAVHRSLHSGMSGPDVRTLQRRLARLHYDVGAVNGRFGYDTQHAVVAFEKIQGLSRDGVAGMGVWQKLNHPRVPTLRHPGSASSTGVEVDLTRQVLYYAVNGRIARILDASTGGGYTYYSDDGSAHRAITPTGHFGVVYKRDGWVHAPLGTLYRPAYFNYDGYAIHGEGEVPPYPASHGCVRITVPAMDRLNSKLYQGISVWIYRS